MVGWCGGWHVRERQRGEQRGTNELQKQKARWQIQDALRADKRQRRGVRVGLSFSGREDER